MAFTSVPKDNCRLKFKAVIWHVSYMLHSVGVQENVTMTPARPTRSAVFNTKKFKRKASVQLLSMVNAKDVEYSTGHLHVQMEYQTCAKSHIFRNGGPVIHVK